LSEGITLLTTTPSISPSLKDDRNQTLIEKGIKLQEPAATLLILETGALKLPTQLRGYWNTFTRIRARDPAEPDVLAVLEQAYSRTARALQITRKGKAAAGVGQLPGRDRPPGNGQGATNSTNQSGRRNRRLQRTNNAARRRFVPSEQVVNPAEERRPAPK